MDSKAPDALISAGKRPCFLHFYFSFVVFFLPLDSLALLEVVLRSGGVAGGAGQKP